MGIFRSEEILHKRIRIPRENAVEILGELGKLDDCLEFIDLTKDDIEAKKNFGLMIKRCEDSDKRIMTFEKICENFNQPIVKFKTYEDFQKSLQIDKNKRDRIYGSTYFDLIESEIIEDERRLIELIDSYTQIKESLEELQERKQVLKKSSDLISFKGFGDQMNKMEEGLESNLNIIAGVVRADDEIKMKRMLFRISRGRAITNFWNVEEENLIKEFEVPRENMKGRQITRKIYSIFFPSGAENILLAKVLKVCDIYNASRYNIPNPNELNKILLGIQSELIDKLSFLNQSYGSIRNFLLEKSGDLLNASRYHMYKLFFKQERMIYANLNKCLVRDTFIDGEVWIPSKFSFRVQDSLKNVIQGNEGRLTANLSDMHSDAVKPTYIPTNEFLFAFQEIVDTYGVPRYQEINPTYFNIVTFPFLFGVMFGDIGHGFLLFLFGIYLCLFNDRINKASNHMLKPVLKARYLLLMMGFFGFYCGWIYNDFFSIPVDFGSCYTNVGDSAVKTDKDCIYPFGMDPKWYVASNELSFLNSLKMKLSVIFGVMHMLFGIILRGINSLYFKNFADLTLQFIPQFIFMGILFGYMDAMIYIKWATDWSGREKDAPSLISQLMNIFLKLGSVVDQPLWGDKLSSGTYVQEWAHFGILIVALICIPIMLFPKPCIDYFQIKKKERLLAHVEQREQEDHEHHKEGHHGHSFGDMFVHQVIETIEFVLGAISNTASYLRLWALSLAHGQLSAVFFQKALLGGIQKGDVIWGAVQLIPSFFVFAGVTFFVLMCMDLMECFLHTLRLHWVEFQNKFYKADGYKFKPFSFKVIMEED